MTIDENFTHDQLTGDRVPDQANTAEGGNGMSTPRIFRLTAEQFRELLATGRVVEAIPVEDEANEDASPKTETSSASSNTVGSQSEALHRSGIRDDGTIISAIARFLQRFVFFKDITYYTLVAAWIVGTYLHKKFEYMGYLFFYSPERRSGKSTTLEILHLLVCQSTGLQVSPTEAVLFRTADGHTQLLDEVDSWKNKDELKDVLNAGYKKGGVVTRCDKGKGGSFKPSQFSVYGPRALAGIGASILHSTTLDRTFAIPMVRQKRDEKRERARERKIGAEAKGLKKKVEDWVKQYENAVVEDYEKGEFPLLECFGDRTIDIAESLVAIVRVAYRGHPESDQAIKHLLQAIAETRSEQHSASPDHLVLRHLYALTENDDPLVGNATELAALCANLETPPNEYALGKMLRRYDFKSKSIRRDGDKPLWRYSLSRAALKEVVERWVDGEGQ